MATFRTVWFLYLPIHYFRSFIRKNSYVHCDVQHLFPILGNETPATFANDDKGRQLEVSYYRKLLKLKTKFLVQCTKQPAKLIGGQQDSFAEIPPPSFPAENMIFALCCDPQASLCAFGCFLDSNVYFVCLFVCVGTKFILFSGGQWQDSPQYSLPWDQLET